MNLDSDTVVLVVDDNRDLADLYTSWLSQSYIVKTAYGGEDALKQINTSIDIVLLDRQMPDVPGERVLDTIRERNLDCQVALVTSLGIDYDILPLRFDDYIQKPVTESDLHTLVESLRIRKDYSDKIQEHFALVSKRVALQMEKDSAEFINHPDVKNLDCKINMLREDIDGLLMDFSDDDYQAIFKALSSEEESDAASRGLS